MQTRLLAVAVLAACSVNASMIALGSGDEAYAPISLYSLSYHIDQYVPDWDGVLAPTRILIYVNEAYGQLSGRVESAHGTAMTPYYRLTSFGCNVGGCQQSPLVNITRSLAESVFNNGAVLRLVATGSAGVRYESNGSVGVSTTQYFDGPPYNVGVGSSAALGPWTVVRRDPPEEPTDPGDIPSEVPEPYTMALVALGLTGLAVGRMR